MQVIRALLVLIALSCVSAASVAQVQQARGKATVAYQGRSASAEDKARANMAAQLKAVEFYYAEAGQSEAENFDAVRDKIVADPDRYILESTVLAEDDSADRKQYTVTLRVSLNVANLRNAVKANSAVARASRTEKSPLAFLFVSRQVGSTKSFDDRVYQRVDATATDTGNGSVSEEGTEGESIRRGQISTNSSSSVQARTAVTASRSIETGGSTVRRASESTWRLMSSGNLNQVFTATFTRAGFKVNEARMVEPYTGGHFSVAKVEDDYKAGMELKPATLQSVVMGMRAAQIPYVALGTLDVGLADKDPNTGLMRVGVTVNAQILDVNQTIPETIASVGPVQYAGVGPTEDEARNNALTLAANSAARELASQATNLGVR